MKHKGSNFEYEEERNDDLMENYIRLIASSSSVNIPEICKRLVNMPAKRFWVTEERTAIMLAKMIKGDKLEKMIPSKREMYMELYKRAVDFMSTNPPMALVDVAYYIIRQPAPKFYLTAKTVEIYIREYKSKYYEKKNKIMQRGLASSRPSRPSRPWLDTK